MSLYMSGDLLSEVTGLYLSNAHLMFAAWDTEHAYFMPKLNGLIYSIHLLRE